jgi:hypothetical protein
MSEPTPSDGHDKEAHPPIKASVNVLVGLCSILIVSSILLQFRQQLSYGSAHVLRRRLSRLTQQDQRNEVSSCHRYPCICHLHFRLASRALTIHACQLQRYIICIAMHEAGCCCVCVCVRVPVRPGPRAEPQAARLMCCNMLTSGYQSYS